MKPMGFVRQVDTLGRVVLPKALRTRYGMDVGAPVEMLVEGERIFLEKYRPKCTFCFSTEDVAEFKEKYICINCLIEIQAISRPEI